MTRKACGNQGSLFLIWSLTDPIHPPLRVQLATCNGIIPIIQVRRQNWRDPDWLSFQAVGRSHQLQNTVCSEHMHGLIFATLIIQTIEVTMPTPRQGSVSVEPAELAS